MDLFRHPDLVDRLAAAYALGTLRGGARRRFETLARQSPAARARVIVWQQHFAVMAELEGAQAPSETTWQRIEAAIHAEAALAELRAAQPAPVVDRLRRAVAVWRGFTAAAAFAAVAAVAIAVQLSARPQIQYVAVLNDKSQAASMLVTFDPKKQTLTLKRVGGYQEAADRSLQLWALPPGQSPKSLGVIEGRPVMKLTAGPADVTTSPALAVSLEPKGGAPVGSGPTGPVLWTGPLLQAPV